VERISHNTLCSFGCTNKLHMNAGDTYEKQIWRINRRLKVYYYHYMHFSKCVLGTSYDCISSWQHRNLPLPNMFDDVSSRDWGSVSSILSKLVITMLFAFSWSTYEDRLTMDTVNREGHAGLKMALVSQYVFDK
jgi:hypothetical protein